MEGYIMTKQEIGAVLMRLREASGKSREYVSEIIGKSVKTIGHWETGYAQPDANTLFLLCTIYGADLNDAFGFSGKTKNAPSTSDEAQEIAQNYDKLDSHGKRVVRVVLQEEISRMDDARSAPIIPHPATLELLRTEQPASAGQGTYLGPERFELLRVLDTPLTRRASFSVPVSGNSMEPHYRDGDTLLIESAEELKPGEIGLFSLDGEGYVKKLGHGELISLNPAYPPIPLDESIRLHGRVIGVLDPNSLIG